MSGVPKLPSHYCPHCRQQVGWIGRLLPRWMHDCGKQTPPHGIDTAPADREIFVWNAMYGWYRTKSYVLDGHRVWPLYGLFGSEGHVWYPVPTFWMEVPPSPTGLRTCNQFDSAELHDKRDRPTRYGR